MGTSPVEQVSEKKKDKETNKRERNVPETK